MTPDELQAAKLELDQRRFRFDRAKAKREHRFIFRHSAVLISGALSLATIAVSIASAFNSSQTTRQNGDIQAEETVRKANAETESTKRAAAETDRKAAFDLLQYITANYDVIYSLKTEKQARIRNAMKPAFSEAALERAFAQLAETAPTSDGPNVWQEKFRKADIDNLSGPPKPVAGDSPPLPKTTEELLKSLTGSNRRPEAERLANTSELEPAVVVQLVTSSLLPQADRWSYRFNLYAALTLARVQGGWRGSKSQFEAVANLRKSGNYADPTFKKWVDAAIGNYRATGA